MNPSEEAIATPSALVDIRWVAAQLTVSERHVRRLLDAGAMPTPVRLGTLLRWRRQAIVDWIAAGCPRGRSGGVA
jgi:excisionase family DNA binding protein